jgi:hypothetical protein
MLAHKVVQRPAEGKVEREYDHYIALVRNKLLHHGPKTDKIDARKLCELLRAGLLTEVFHSTSALYELRLLVSAYEDVVRAGIRLLNQQAALKLGHRDNGKSAAFIGGILTENIELYQRSKEEYERRFRDSARRNSLVRFQKQLPGIGIIGAVKIVACVVDAVTAGAHHATAGCSHQSTKLPPLPPSTARTR